MGFKLRHLPGFAAACLGVALGMHASSAQAQLAQVTGSASIDVGTGFFSSKPSADDTSRAKAAARASLWKNYTSRFSPARLAQMDGRHKEIEARLEEFISDLTIVDQEHDKASNTLKIAVRANVNTAAVDRYFASLGRSGGEPRSAGSPNAEVLLAFVFLARQVESIREFDARRVTVNETIVGQRQSRADREAEATTAGEAVESSSTDKAVAVTHKTETGGSTTRRAAQVKYRVESSQNIDTDISDVLNSAGFEMASYEDIVGSCGGPDLPLVRKDFVESDEMGSGLRKQVLDSAKQCEVRYMSIGTLDVGAADVDPVTGNKRVSVSVRAQVIDLQPRLPRRVASVGPIRLSGLGPDEQIATANALKRAASEAARNIVDQLNVKGVR